MLPTNLLTVPVRECTTYYTGPVQCFPAQTGASGLVQDSGGQGQKLVSGYMYCWCAAASVKAGKCAASAVKVRQTCCWSDCYSVLA